MFWADSTWQNPLHGGCKDTCSSSTCANDTLFVETLLDELESTLCIDRRRVHVTGISNGGMMAYQTGVVKSQSNPHHSNLHHSNFQGCL